MKSNKTIYGYIYLIVNNVNHKTYIGQKKLKSNAWNKDGYLGSGRLIKKAIEKYGKESFEKFLIQFCETKEELDKQEIFWIAEYKKRGLAQYNIAIGGQGGALFKGHKHSEESKKKIAAQKGWKQSELAKDKISKANMGKSNPFYGKKHSEETLEKMKNSHKGHKASFRGHHSEESKKKISEAVKGQRWWNNGQIRVRSIICPGPDFRLGRKLNKEAA